MSRERATDLQQAVQGLYDAVVMPEAWPSALHAFARATNSVGCFFYPKDQAQAVVQLPVSPDMRENLAAYVSEGWHRHDFRVAKSWPLAVRGKTIVKPILTDDDLATAEERRSSLFFQEFQRPWGLSNWACIIFKADGELWAMPLVRSDRQGPVTPAQARALATASPQLGRVIELATLVDARRAAEHLTMLHLSGAAAALLDWRGVVSGLTPAAETLLGADVSVHRGFLSARHRPSEAELQKLIEAALTNPEMKAIPDSIAIAREGRRPFLVRAIPLTGTLAAAFGQARVLLLFTDLDKTAPPPCEMLRNTFGLTPAEARLAAELASGDALDDAAERLGIAKETARNQLKAIFQKTDVHRQSELVALLGKLPRQLLIDKFGIVNRPCVEV